MTIYVDDITSYASGDWCHMWTDGTREELDRFAVGIGLKTKWAQTSRGRIGEFYHYDLRPSKRILAIKRGAVEMQLMDWIRLKLAEEPQT